MSGNDYRDVLRLKRLQILLKEADKPEKQRNMRSASRKARKVRHSMAMQALTREERKLVRSEAARLESALQK